MTYIEPIAKGLEESRLLHLWQEGDRYLRCCGRAHPIAFWEWQTPPQGYTVCSRQ